MSRMTFYIGEGDSVAFYGIIPEVNQGPWLSMWALKVSQSPIQLFDTVNAGEQRIRDRVIDPRKENLINEVRVMKGDQSHFS